MIITLVRHGKTKYNCINKIQGRNNESLNNIGRVEVRELREKLKDKKFNYCYTSPLSRCVETAFILVGDKTLIVKDERLIERDMGEYEGINYKDYDSNKYWDYDLNCSDNLVEPIKDVFKRCRDFLNDLEKRYTNESILIVTHGAIYRVLRCLISKDNRIDNCGYEEINYKR